MIPEAAALAQETKEIPAHLGFPGGSQPAP
jgi:hypothetical protein